MNNFLTLYCCECKKIIRKKIVWISFALCVAMAVLSSLIPLLGSYYVNGEFIDTNYKMYLTDKKYSSALNGREIDQALLDETVSAYRKIPESMDENYALTNEYQQYARPYSAIFNFIHQTTAMDPSAVRLTWHPNENDLYAQRQSFLEALMVDNALSDGEKQFWKNRETQISKPFIYKEHESFEQLLSSFQTVGLLALMFISISLSGIFFDEHARKTDQILLCCPFGKTKLYWIKIAAGTSFSIISASILFAASSLTAFILYGTEGNSASFQFIYPRNSDPITCGQALWIAYVCMIFAAIAVSVSVMVLSEFLHSNMATLAVSAGLLIMPMFISIPEHYRAAAQIWNWLPWCFLTLWNVFDQYTLPLFGHYFVPWQAAPMLYLAASIAIVLIGKPLYKRYQIIGR